MKKPIFVRDLTEEEEARLKQGLRSKDGFDSPAHRALATAIITDPAVVPPEKLAQVELLVGQYVRSV